MSVPMATTTGTTILTPDRPTIRSLEERHLNTWPGLGHAFVDGWVLRQAGGVSRRANSAWPLHAPAGPLDDRLSATERFFEAAGLDPVVRVTALAEPTLDAALAARGYRFEDPSLVRMAPLDQMAAPANPGSVALSDEAGAWLEAHAVIGGLTPDEQITDAAIHRALAAPRCYAHRRIDGEPAACAFAALDRGMAMIYAVQVSPRHRRRGLATDVLLALFAWARDAGAATALLQVQGDNTGALALYSRLGFRTVYGYHYRAKRRAG